MTILNILGMQDDPHGKGICSLWEAFTNLFAVDTPHYHTAFSWLLLAGGAVLAFCTLRSQKARKRIMRNLLPIAVVIFMLGTSSVSMVKEASTILWSCCSARCWHPLRCSFQSRNS